MEDENQRVDWSALMDAHGMEPDADTRPPAIEPDRRRVVDPEAGRAARRSRLVHAVVALTALFSIAASVAVLMAISGDDEPSAVAGSDPAVSLAARPAAFQQTTAGVAVVPPPETHREPEVVEPPPVAEASPLDTVIPAREGEEHPRPPVVTPSPPEWDEERPHPPVVTSSPPAPEKKRPDKRATRAETAGKQAAGKDDAAGTSAKEAPQPTAAETPDPNLPDEPDKDGVASAMAALEKDIAACAAPAKLSGEVGIKMRIQPDGSVAWAAAKVQNSPFQACLDRLFKKARMPKSQKGATVRQTVELP